MRPPVQAEPIAFARPDVCDEARAAAARVLESGWLTTGPEVERFQEEFAATVGADHAVAVSSCTAAIEIALRALRLRPGARVATPTMTFCGAVNAIVHAGLRPVLVDVDPRSLMTSPDLVAAAGPVDAMVPLHFGGDPAPVEALALAAGLPLDRLVEDAAHALGTRVGDCDVGAISGATCFSFYATKNLPIGEGGMITTGDDRIAEFAGRASLHGMSHDAWRRYAPGARWRYSVEIEGLKANMTDLQAAIGRAQLRHLDAWQRRRAGLADRYDRGLAGVPGIGLPHRPARGRHAWHLYVIRVEPDFGVARDALIDALAERGISCSVHFIPVHRHPYFRALLSTGDRRFPGADLAFERIVSLPLYPGLREEEVDRVCAEIADVGASPR
jgi:dTDP-4-amino-4,6-dideoxygalactose transaminase